MMAYLRMTLTGTRRTMRQRMGLVRTYYVGPGGDDRQDGLTVATRKRSLQAVNGVAQPGDAVHILTPDEIVRLAMEDADGEPATFLRQPLRSF